MNLLVFNPEHDYALADNHPHFVALRSAAKFAYDCAPFVRYLSDNDNVVFSAYRKEKDDYRKVFDAFEAVGTITKVIPWGWDAAVVYQLQRVGVPVELLPTETQLQKIRELAHRKTTIQAIKFLREQHPNPEQLPLPPIFLTSVQEVVDFVKNTPDAIFKSPYSGNGRGHLYAHNECNPTLLRQCEGVIKHQGGILAEKQYPVIQDFAMEFSCDRGAVTFRGYSLFKTVHYGYGGNLLMPDEEILRTLSTYINVEELQQTEALVSRFLEHHIAPHYDGDAGVDMFVYQEDGEYKLHPFVEVNLRKTMGLAAHDIYARYCHPESCGTFQILRGSIETLHATSLQNPMQTCDDLWYTGTYFLTPVSHDTQYAVVVSLDSKKV